MTINPNHHNTIESIALVYKMSPITLRELISHLLPSNQCRVFTHLQVLKIVQYLGEPDLIESTIDPVLINTNSKLAAYYNVSRKTFSKWILPIKSDLKTDNLYRRRYLPKEVRMIVDLLGS